MPYFNEPLRIQELPCNLRKSSHLGAEVILPSSMPIFDLDALSSADKETLSRGLYDNGVLVIRNQKGIDATALPKIGRFFDDSAWDMHSGGEKQVTNPENILSQNRGARVPKAPQVSVIGKGKFEGHEGIPNLDLKHVDHTEFHESPHTGEEINDGFTRPYRWHMDAPLYENLPGRVTILHSIVNPDLPDQKIKFETGQVMPISAGATAFFSGARNFQLLSPEEKEFALNTTVQYAPRAYEWMRDCKATPDGLTIAKTGREKSLEELPEWSWKKVHSFPMVWKNHGNGDPHLQILGCCVYSLTTVDPITGNKIVIDDLEEVRKICHGLQKRMYTPENIYAHRWQEGDVVIFHNRGVLHSITGQLSRHEERRLLWQCTLASGAEPVAYQA